MPAYLRAGRLAAALLTFTLAACGDDPAGPRDDPPPPPMLIAYSHEADDSTARIAVMHPDGTGFRTLTTGSTSSWAPSWTRDGEGLVFMSFRQERARLHSVPLTGGEGTLIPTGEPHAYEGEWSPDGSTLAVATAGGILLVTDGVARALDTPQLPGDPRWSPDGTRLVFEAGGVGNAGDLYVVTLASGQVVPLTRTPEAERTPDWSPDGARIAFSRGPYPGDRHVWTMHADGSDARQLTTVPGQHTVPRWRPAR